MRRNIDVANGQVDHVGEVVQITISGCTILDDFDYTVQTLTNGISQVSVGERDDVIKVISHRTDKLTQGGDTATQGGGHPAFQELLS